MLVKQPSARPTNKLTAATLGALIVSVASVALLNLAPEWHDATVFNTLTPVVVGLLGYLVKDEPNT